MFGQRVGRGAGEGGHNLSRDDCEYVGVGKHDGLSVVLLTGAADLRFAAGVLRGILLL